MGIQVRTLGGWDSIQGWNVALRLIPGWIQARGISVDVNRDIGGPRGVVGNFLWRKLFQEPGTGWAGLGLSTSQRRFLMSRLRRIA